MKLTAERVQATMTKSRAIREVVSKISGLTNKQIREEVKRQYGITVFDNQVIQVAGSFAARTAQNGFPTHLLKQAKAFLLACGGEYQHAKRLLEMVVPR